jgi:hypothetical protein
MTDLVYQTTLGGNLTLRATNTASNPIITIPAVTANMVTTGDTATVTANMIVPGALSQTATYTQGGTGSVSRTIQNKLQESVSVKDFGATGDGATDDTTAIQNAINYVFSLNGGVVYFPKGIYVCNNLQIKSGITLTSLAGQYGYLPSSLSGATLKSTATGWTIITPTGGATSAAIVGLNFQGPGGSITCGGINLLTGSSWVSIKQCQFNNYTEQAINVLGIAHVIEDILTTNVVLNKSRSASIGAITLNGTDSFLSRIEANTSSSSLSSANYYVSAILVEGANHFISNCVGEISDVGFEIQSNSSRFVNCRADNNYAHGFNITGGINQFSNCFALNNGLATTNTYSGFNLNTSQGNLLSTCNAVNDGVTLQQYCFYDNSNYTAVSSRNVMVGCFGSGYGTALTYTNSYLGSGPLWNPTLIRVSTGTTIDVSGTTLISLEHSAPTNITNFTGGTQGQTIKFTANTNITLVNSSTIKTNTGANKTLVANKVYTFTNFGALTGNWIENA